MDLNAGAYGVAALVATAGLWWFAYFVTGLKRAAPAIRYGVYAAIWFAYFVLVLILAAHGAAK